MLKISEILINCANAWDPKYNIFPMYKMYNIKTGKGKGSYKYFETKAEKKVNRNLCHSVFTDRNALR